MANITFQMEFSSYDDNLVSWRTFPCPGTSNICSPRIQNRPIARMASFSSCLRLYIKIGPPDSIISENLLERQIWGPHPPIRNQGFSGGPGCLSSNKPSRGFHCTWAQVCSDSEGLDPKGESLGFHSHTSKTQILIVTHLTAVLQGVK